jgi:hypothetical protein
LQEVLPSRTLLLGSGSEKENNAALAPERKNDNIESNSSVEKTDAAPCGSGYAILV